MYETRPVTWIVATLVGVALALGLLAAGDSYVRIAEAIAPYGADVVKLETVTVTAPRGRTTARTTGDAPATADARASGLGGSRSL